MLKLRPKILRRNGRREFVILSYEEFQAIQERLEDAADLLALRQARQEDDASVPGYTLEEVRMELGRRGGRARPRKAGKAGKRARRR
jgi:hypothetical protein